MKKVLLLAPISSVHERFNIVNVKALQELGYEVHLAANFSLTQHDLAYRDKCDQEGIFTHQIDFVRGSLLHNLRTIPLIKKLFKGENFDIVHAHTETGGILVRLAMGASQSAKFVYTPHGMSFYKGSSFKSQLIYRPIEKFICRKMDANLAMNKEELAVLQKWNSKTAYYVHGIGLDVEGIQAIECDRDAVRAEFNIPSDAVVIISVGELNDNKNHKTVLEAVCELNQDNIYYIICGEGANREKLLEIAGAKGFSERLILTGYRYDVKKILKAADIFAFPSYHEGLPVSLMEAMAVGLPVVCSEIRGNIDLIVDGENGFLCPLEMNNYKHAIQKIIENKDIGSEFATRNRFRILEFSDKKVLEELKSIYGGENKNNEKD